LIQIDILICTKRTKSLQPERLLVSKYGKNAFAFSWILGRKDGEKQEGKQCQKGGTKRRGRGIGERRRRGPY